MPLDAIAMCWGIAKVIGGSIEQLGVTKFVGFDRVGRWLVVPKKRRLFLGGIKTLFAKVLVGLFGLCFGFVAIIATMSS